MFLQSELLVNPDLEHIIV